jgi:hypothetical protein
VLLIPKQRSVVPPVVGDREAVENHPIDFSITYNVYPETVASIVEEETASPEAIFG